MKSSIVKSSATTDSKIKKATNCHSKKIVRLDENNAYPTQREIRIQQVEKNLVKLLSHSYDLTTSRELSNKISNFKEIYHQFLNIQGSMVDDNVGQRAAVGVVHCLTMIGSLNYTSNKIGSNALKYLEQASRVCLLIKQIDVRDRVMKFVHKKITEINEHTLSSSLNEGNTSLSSENSGAKKPIIDRQSNTHDSRMFSSTPTNKNGVDAAMSINFHDYQGELIFRPSFEDVIHRFEKSEPEHLSAQQSLGSGK